jgi:hypothetical protein
MSGSPERETEKQTGREWMRKRGEEQSAKKKREKEEGKYRKKHSGTHIKREIEGKLAKKRCERKEISILRVTMEKKKLSQKSMKLWS